MTTATTTTTTTLTTCAICANVLPYEKTLDIWVGKEETHYEICGPCNRKIRHLQTTSPQRFNSLPSLEA